ncbi:MAG TPA: DNA gyrase inhibitor YacG [Stellaceae bacterium]|jgi:endogenous inhibitor of DNA gyrase (YacG/DUF329 family)|nr:DNA gyrase inhibitor YacG [Stellaceae bacterium]
MPNRQDPNAVTTLPGFRRRCPVCGKPAAGRHAPFCSPRCAEIDLGRWLKGVYRVETGEPADPDPTDSG